MAGSHYQKPAQAATSLFASLSHCGRQTTNYDIIAGLLNNSEETEAFDLIN